MFFQKWDSMDLGLSHEKPGTGNLFLGKEQEKTASR